MHCHTAENRAKLCAARGSSQTSADEGIRNLIDI